jgi:hypothetical protein
MKRDQGYMTRLRESHPAGARKHREDHEGRRTVLWLSVAGMMAFITALWFMVMPIQMSGLRLGGMKRSVMNPSSDKTAIEQWSELVDGASSRLKITTDGIAAKAASVSAPPATAAALDAAALTARLEAAVASAPLVTAPATVSSR